MAAENRLKLKLEILEGDSNEIQNLKKQLNENNAKLNDVLELMKLRIEDNKEWWKEDGLMFDGWLERTNVA